MSTQIQTDHFSKALLGLLDETFEHVQGYYLDKGTSMFETLAEISAEEASIPVGGKCATLAAQVKHTAFYLDVLEKGLQTQQFEKVDWGQIWRETTAVPPKMAFIQANLRESYNRIRPSSTTPPNGKTNNKLATPSPPLFTLPITWARFGRRFAP